MRNAGVMQRRRLRLSSDLLRLMSVGAASAEIVPYWGKRVPLMRREADKVKWTSYVPDLEAGYVFEARRR